MAPFAADVEDVAPLTELTMGKLVLRRAFHGDTAPALSYDAIGSGCRPMRPAHAISTGAIW